MIISNQQLVNGLIPEGLLDQFPNDNELIFSGCTDLTALPENLPAGITKLDLSDCRGLTALPENLPAGITWLDLSGCRGLTALPENLPAEITDLELSGCRGLTALPENLPAEITWLNLSGCRGLTALPENLLAGITRLDLSGCTGLTALPENLPARITWLDLFDCRGLTALPENLPEGITWLNLSYCTGLTALPENLLAGITDLNLSYCTDLTALPENLPAEITRLNLSGCTGLTALPENLPAGITRLNLSYCTGLTALPENLPAGITDLNLSYCTNLIFTASLISQLQALESNGAQIVYPRHFNLADQSALAEQRLQDAITNYKKDNPNSSTTHITNLLHRFLTEGITQRGGIKEVISSVFPILDAITANPNHLKWIEEIASGYLDGCVNQPTAGWSEISAVMSIAKSEGMLNKVEAARHLRSLDAIKSFIGELREDSKPGKGVEVEFGNALLREVHKDLLAQGSLSEPWLGVPGPIAYEGTISNFINPAMTMAAIAHVMQDALEVSVVKIAEYLCEGHHQQAWVDIAFPEEVAKIKEQFTKDKHYLSEALYLEGKLMDGKEMEAELSEIFDEDDQEKKDEFAKKFNEEKSDFYKAARESNDKTSFLDKLNARFCEISDIKERETIFSEARRLTLEGLGNAPSATAGGPAGAKLGQDTEAEASL